MATKYSAPWIRNLVKEKGAGWLSNHPCGICGIEVGYIFGDTRVYFRAGCDCSWTPDTASGYDEIAEWLALQDSDEVRDKILKPITDMPTLKIEIAPAKLRQWLEEYSGLLAASINMAYASGAQGLDSAVAEAKQRLKEVDSWLKETYHADA
jgi:hypothetical protein